MNDKEVYTLALAIVVNLISIEENKLLALPVDVTITDADDRLIADTSFAGKGSPNFRDVFGVGHLPLNFAEVRLPVTLLVEDSSGKTLTAEFTQGDIDKYLSDAEKFIQ